jgi:hypothetical protein
MTQPMQKTLVLLLTGLMAGTLNAAVGPNLLVNGHFQSGAAGWSRWWGGNSGLPVTDPIEGDLCAGVWWNDDGIFQTLSLPEAGLYEFGGKLLTTGGLTNRRAVIEAKIDNGSYSRIQQLDIVPGAAATTWHSVNGTLLLTTPASVTITLMLVNETGTNPAGIGFFGDIFIKRVIPQAGRNYYGAKLEPQTRVMHTAGQSVSDFNDYWNVMDPGEKPACYMTYCKLVTPFMPALRQDLERYRRDYGVYLPSNWGCISSASNTKSPPASGMRTSSDSVKISINWDILCISASATSATAPTTIMIRPRIKPLSSASQTPCVLIMSKQRPFLT